LTKIRIIRRYVTINSNKTQTEFFYPSWLFYRTILCSTSMPDSRKPKTKVRPCPWYKKPWPYYCSFNRIFFESALVFCRFQSTQTANWKVVHIWKAWICFKLIKVSLFYLKMNDVIDCYFDRTEKKLFYIIKWNCEDNSIWKA
jgi:hypothetical protein